MTKILDWRRSDDPRDVVHLAVQALVEGHIVAVPTETCYVLVASALQEVAVRSLDTMARSDGQGPLTVIPRSPDEALDMIPKLGVATRRLIRKAWPTPLVLQHQNSDPFSSLRCLSDDVYARLQTPAGELRLWQPSHEVLNYISKLVAGPLVCGVASNRHRPDQPSESVGDLVVDQAVLAIDAGRVESPGLPTVVAVDGNRGRIVRSGVIDRSQLESLSQLVILFVCTGNTCRSPMASALMRKKIAEQLGPMASEGCGPIVAISAGVSAYGGDPASHGALQAIRAYDLCLEDHQSTQLNSFMVEQADLILAMGQRHRNVILSQWPETAYKVHLIAADGGEISDPFGGSLDMYQKCAEQLDRHTSHWVKRLDMTSLIQWE
jgi:protein-tyrosine-phosphatase/tRNA A37 threonylcarbamoyladenosine synthetase subunit TsaC/SUA5/YrdC